MNQEGKRERLPHHERLENLSYQAAFRHCHEEERAAETARTTLARLEKYSNRIAQMDPLDQKSLVCLVTTYHILSQNDLEEDLGQLDEKTIQNAGNLEADDLVYTYNAVLDKMGPKMRALFLLAVHFRLSDRQIAQFLDCDTDYISRAIEEISESLSRLVKDEEVDPDLRRESMQRACSFQLKSLVDRLEAVSSLNPRPLHEHRRVRQELRPSEGSAQETQPVDSDVASAPRAPKTSESKKANDSLWGALQRGDFFSRRAGYYLSGLLALLVLILLARFTIFKPAPKEKKVASESVISLASQSESSEPITAEHPIPARYYSHYENLLLFVDPETGMVYECPRDGAVREVLNILPAMKDHAGIHHIGKVEEVIYLAFMDGKGAKISGQPAKLQIEPYWQKVWFEGQLEGLPQVQSPFVYNGISFQFQPPKQ